MRIKRSLQDRVNYFYRYLGGSREGCFLNAHEGMPKERPSPGHVV